jgi:hypothetical protein
MRYCLMNVSTKINFINKLELSLAWENCSSQTLGVPDENSLLFAPLNLASALLQFSLTRIGSPP